LYGKYLLTKLTEDLNSSPYSFTVDISTVSRTNITSLEVRYLKEHYDNQGNQRTQIENRTVGLKYLKQSSSAKTMFDISNEKLLSLSPEVKLNLVGYIHDHAANLSGVHQGLGVLLKSNVNAHLVDIKDPCHSINLALYQGFEILPEEITKFIKKIHNHFISPQRVAYLNNLQLENNFKLLSPKHYVQTRWLSLGQSLERVLEIWDSLVCYMRLRPKFQGVTKAQYDKFISLLEDNKFKMKIIFVTAIFKKLNEANILFQNQQLEIQNLLLGTQLLIKEFARLILKSEEIPKDIKSFKDKQWEEIENYSSKFINHQEFISILITDLDKDLFQLENLSEDEKKLFAKDFQSFIAKIFNRLIYYLPFADELINTLDFVNLNQEPDELKKKILVFNKALNIVSFEKINELVKEINQLNEENLILAKKEAKRSSLFLWDLIKQFNDQEYKLLDKIFLTAHALPTSSAAVEQSFSYLKLIKSAVRNRLHEDTVQSLILINEEHRDKNIVIPDKIIELFEEQSEERNKRKNPKKEDLIKISLDKKIESSQIDQNPFDQNSQMEIEEKKSNSQREFNHIEKKDLKHFKLNLMDENEDANEFEEKYSEREIEGESKDSGSINSNDDSFSLF